MIDKRIKFDERYDDEDYKTTTLYFIAPKEMLKTIMTNDYPDAVSMEISIEFPMGYIDATYADVCVSPTSYDKETNSYYEYDWYYIDMPYNEINELILLAERS